jgi:hypothetical protein
MTLGVIMIPDFPPPLAPKSADIPKKNTVSDEFSQMHFPKRGFSQ